MAASLLLVTFDKCRHFPGLKKLYPFKNSSKISDIFAEYHGVPTSEKSGPAFTVSGSTHVNTDETSANTTLDTNLCVGDLASFGIKSLYLKCNINDDDPSLLGAACADSARKKEVDAFQLLMSKGREFPAKRMSSSGMVAGSGVNAKDVLYNRLVDMFVSQKLDFPRSSIADGQYLIQVLCNALWFVTNHHNTIKQAAKTKGVAPIPPPFDSEEFQNLNNSKKKKVKMPSITSNELNSHSQALYSLLLKPVMKSSPAWCKAHDDIKSLADSLNSYREYLVKKLDSVKLNQGLDHPVRTVGEHATVEHIPKAMFLNRRYFKLDAQISSLKEGDYVFFNEDEHLNEPFTNNMQRHRYLSELQLSVPVDIYRFCPGSSVITTVCFVVVTEHRTEQQMLTQGARFVLQHKDRFQEFHTRTQKRAFKEKLSNVATVLPSVADFIYKELVIDATKAEHPDMEERIRLIFLGEKGLLVDLRKMNNGGPSGTFDTFFEHLSAIVEEVTAADDRRQGNAHLSSWISLDDLIEQASERCPPDTPVPSKSLVRLQFAPRNPYAKSSWNFTSRIEVQYKIQRRQLRLSHPDQHYCNAILKYVKEFAVEMNSKCKVVMLCCDDKAKVPIGEPGFSVSTGVRGKQSIVPTSSTLVAADHDMTKSSLTPSVILECMIPDSAEKSFVRGKVHVTVNDSVFQTSNPFRHAATVTKVLEEQPDINTLILYTDGGTDHRNTLVSVQCSAICLFKQFNLDMLILARCSPGHSWRNPAERIMSILNIGLQNCSLEREKCSDHVEKALKKCGSMKETREKATTEVKQAYVESVEPVQATIKQRFSRLKLKDEPIRVMDSMTELDIDLIKRHLRELFPNLNLQKLQKNETKKVAQFGEWIGRHCRERQYIFQLRKCSDGNCCVPGQNPLPDDVVLQWLPDPVLMGNQQHYRSYSDSKGKETDESDRPSTKPLDPIKYSRKRTHSPDAHDGTVNEEPVEQNMDSRAPF